MNRDIRKTDLVGSDPIQALATFRAQFQRSQGFVHMNNAGQAPPCQPALDMMATWARRFAVEGYQARGDRQVAVERARAQLALFLGARPHEVSFFPGTSAAISQIALAFPLRENDEVVIWDQEYPSNFLPWKIACERRQARLVVARSNPDLSTPISSIERLVTTNTRVIATSWVQFSTGAIVDLKGLTSIARARGIFTCADIIQGAGVLPFHFGESGLDAAAGGSHKWTVSTPGAGFLCLREEHASKFDPIVVGAKTFSDRGQLGSRGGFESGSMPYLEVLALGAAAGFIHETGMAHLTQEIEVLSGRLSSGLAELGYQLQSPNHSGQRGAIVNFSPSKSSPIGTASEVEAKLRQHKISYAMRGPGIRLSPHALNTKDEIEQILEVLARSA